MDQALLSAEALLQNYNKLEAGVPSCKKIMFQRAMDIIFITPTLVELSLQLFQFGHSEQYAEMEKHDEGCGCFSLVDQFIN